MTIGTSSSSRSLGGGRQRDDHASNSAASGPPRGFSQSAWDQSLPGGTRGIVEKKPVLVAEHDGVSTTRLGSGLQRSATDYRSRSDTGESPNRCRLDSKKRKLHDGSSACGWDSSFAKLPQYVTGVDADIVRNLISEMAQCVDLKDGKRFAEVQDYSNTPSSSRSKLQ